MKLEYYRGGPVGFGTTTQTGEWVNLTTDSPDIQTGGARGVFGGGDNPSDQNVIEYITISTTGNSIDFGDLTDAKTSVSGCASRTRGLFCGGYYPTEAKIEYITISSTGNASIFGDLTQHRIATRSLSSSTRGITAGGRTSPTPAQSQFNIIDYVTIASISNSIDFGDLSQSRNSIGSFSSSTRGVFGGGYSSPGTDVNTIDFITISTLGNAADFGDLITSTARSLSCSNSTRGLFAGGADPALLNTIQYITIATLGNSIDFGDLTVSRAGGSGAASPVRGVFIGGSISPGRTNTIDYVQIMTTGNAIDFGDMNTSTPPSSIGALSNGHGGLG
jgi:hypothetical protein